MKKLLFILPVFTLPADHNVRITDDHGEGKRKVLRQMVRRHGFKVYQTGSSLYSKT